MSVRIQFTAVIMQVSVQLFLPLNKQNIHVNSIKLHIQFCMKWLIIVYSFNNEKIVIDQQAYEKQQIESENTCIM